MKHSEICEQWRNALERATSFGEMIDCNGIIHYTELVDSEGNIQYYASFPVLKNGETIADWEKRNPVPLGADIPEMDIRVLTECPFCKKLF